MAGGILLTAALTLAAGLGFAVAADRVRMRRTRAKQDVGVVFLFFATLAAMLVAAGLREAAAWAALTDPAWMVVDRMLFYVACGLAAVAIVPLAHLVSDVTWGPRTWTWAITYGFSALAVIGVLLLVQGGISGPHVDAWGSDWHIESQGLTILILVAAVLPGLWAMWGLANRARHLPTEDARRIQCVAGACALYVSVLALGAAGVPGAWVLIERGAYIVASLAAVSAYAPSSAKQAIDAHGVPFSD